MGRRLKREFAFTFAAHQNAYLTTSVYNCVSAEIADLCFDSLHSTDHCSNAATKGSRFHCRRLIVFSRGRHSLRFILVLISIIILSLVRIIKKLNLINLNFTVRGTLVRMASTSLGH